MLTVGGMFELLITKVTASAPIGEREAVYGITDWMETTVNLLISMEALTHLLSNSETSVSHQNILHCQYQFSTHANIGLLQSQRAGAGICTVLEYCRR